MLMKKFDRRTRPKLIGLLCLRINLHDVAETCKQMQGHVLFKSTVLSVLASTMVHSTWAATAEIAAHG